MTEIKEAPAKSYEDLQSELQELQEAITRKDAELKDLAREKGELVSSEPSHEVAELLGNALPKRLTGKLAQIGEREEQARVSLYLLKRSYLEAQIVADEAFIAENEPIRKGAIRKATELRDRIRELEDLANRHGNEAHTLNYQIQERKRALRQRQYQLKKLSESGYWEL